ncbi:hypothetical protein JOD45_003014 [Scopulibacillus daqui]|uniref:Uncharacterized protein n=1 Tax=Scopulibacillus daqui TaxID=1469162 RepID=A0ABS2Q4A3_9BACL|nr:hypothetical protein [Scopulibacillus daqui]MBM7646780.1 hypothetical protein [Scopulibacillus daqui]
MMENEQTQPSKNFIELYFLRRSLQDVYLDFESSVNEYRFTANHE